MSGSAPIHCDNLMNTSDIHLSGVTLGIIISTALRPALGSGSRKRRPYFVRQISSRNGNQHRSASAFQRSTTRCSVAICSSLVNGATFFAANMRARSNSGRKIDLKAFSPRSGRRSPVAIDQRFLS